MIVSPVELGHWNIGYRYWLLVTGYWLLVTGYWLLVTGYWLLVMLSVTKRNAENGCVEGLEHACYSSIPIRATPSHPPECESTAVRPVTWQT